MIRAAITIGSNSTRSLVADVTDALHVIHRGREETRLMMGMDEAGFITPRAMAQTVAAVADLYREALAMGAKDVTLMATSATRDAQNSNIFVQRLREATGLDTRIISGQEEAALAFRAAAGNENCLVFDIGGGSTELTYGEKGQILASRSAQVGASRLLKIQPIECMEDADRILSIARDIIREALCGMLPGGKAFHMTGLGGSCTTCASLLMKREAHGEEVEGVRVTIDDVRRFLHTLSPLMPAARAEFRGLPRSRVHHFPHGLCILLAVMEEAGAEAFTVSGRTNLDGYLMQFAD